MIHERLYIEKYDWVADCFFEVRGVDDASHILSLLQAIGTSRSVYQRARRHLMSGKRDTGFTFSSYSIRESVVIIGETSSHEEALNTFSHELRHLADDIMKASDMPLHGEPAAYLTGDIAMALFTSVVKVICGCKECSEKVSE